MSRVSYCCSEYHEWFQDLGYPLLDIHQYEDGEWSIIQYLRTPYLPSLTHWNVVLKGMRHVEISRSFVEKYVQKLDLKKKEFWANEEAKTKKMEEEKEAVERHRNDSVDRACTAIRNNPDLVERIGKNGIEEINLDKIARHIPNYQF